MAVSGVDFIVQIEDSGNPGTYNTLGGQRDAKFNRTTSEADATAKDTAAGWHAGLPILREWSITCDHLLLESDVAYGDLETAWFNNTQINVQITTPAAHTYTGAATITELSISAPHDNVAVVALTLKGSLAVTKV